ncbi:MAG: ParB/RepB/Spo0J family partition protein [Acidobacteriota bacterium]|nr:ParB/RepB/Spo0J family partition protein [Acidobacteriota bacterium]
MDKRPALGKGLSALIPDAPAPTPGPIEVDIDLLSPNRYQPRARVDETALAELAESIKANGIIQPIVVRRAGQRYEIIAGERRWRAAQRAGLHRVPVAIRQVADGEERSLLEMALVENVQRADLNPIEEAEAYRRMTDEFHRTQEEVAAAVGKDRASVANYLRLLKLPEELRAEIAGGRLSMGHARALLGLADAAAQRNLSRDVLARGLSVRDTEALVRKLAGGGKPPAPAPKKTDVHTRAAEEQLRLTLGTAVRIVRRGKKGRIEIDFGSEDELIRIYDQLTDGTSR